MTTKVLNEIKQPTNLQEVNLNSIIERDVKKYFNNFFEVPIEVTTNIDTAITSYFDTITDTKDAAKALASAVIYTSLKQGTNPMNVLDEFKKLQPGELNEYIAMFLNLDRVGTSFLGVKNTPAINSYVTRTILP